MHLFIKLVAGGGGIHCFLAQSYSNTAETLTWLIQAEQLCNGEEAALKISNNDIWFKILLLTSWGDDGTKLLFQSSKCKVNVLSVFELSAFSWCMLMQRWTDRMILPRLRSCWSDGNLTCTCSDLLRLISSNQRSPGSVSTPLRIVSHCCFSEITLIVCFVLVGGDCYPVPRPGPPGNLGQPCWNHLIASTASAPSPDLTCSPLLWAASVYLA